MATKLEQLNFDIVVTLLCWGVWGIFDKKALQSSTHMAVLFRLYAMVLWELPLIMLCLNYWQPGWQVSGELWLWTFWAGVAAVFALASYLVAMSLAEASLVLAVTAAYPVVTQWLAVWFLGEKLVFARIIGAAAIALGVAAIGFSQTSEPHAEKQDRRRNILLWTTVALATLGWGIWGILEKKALAYGSPVTTWFAEVCWEFVFMLAGCALAFVRGYRVEVSNRQAWWFALLSAVCLAIGRIVFMSALKISTASYVIAITGCYPLLMYLLALCFLKERFSTVRLAGIGLVVVGGLAVQMTAAV